MTSPAWFCWTRRRSHSCSGKEYGDLGAMAERMTAEWQAIADSAAKSSRCPETKRESAFFRMIASEHREMFGETARLVGGISTFGDIPLVVMAAGKPNPALRRGGRGVSEILDRAKPPSDRQVHKGQIRARRRILALPLPGCAGARGGEYPFRGQRGACEVRSAATGFHRRQ